MKVILAFLPLLGLVFSAPAEIEKRAIVKRAEEVMMYGNQQNLPKVAKKSDPNLPVMPPSDKDRSGSVEAEPAHDIKPSVEGDMSNNQNGVETVESELTNVGSTDSKSAEEEPQVSESKTSEESEADFVKNLPPEEAEAIKELEEAEKAQKEGDSKENNESDQSKEEENSTNEQDQSNALNRYKNRYNMYQAYRAYQNLFNNYPSYFSNYEDYFLNRRRRRAAKGKYLLHKSVKRTHRSKRDLPYPEDEVYFNPYYFPETDLPESYDRFEPVLEADDTEEVDPYVLAKELYPAIANSANGLPFTDDDGYEIQEIIYEGQPGYFIPAKQDIEIVPSDKRSPYFYPFSEEPGTHFKAFVPQKREYLDAYERLVRLARALAMRPSGREDVVRGYEWEKK